ncbi:phosphotransferase [Ruegeria sp.]|uniref:phosphotransferase n=1 Tax=Ruegeria sp. TaxID=1879320 RepID=UPI003C7BB825
MGNPLTDLPLPPPGLVKQLADGGLTKPKARFDTLYGGRTNQVWKVQDGRSDAVLKLYRSGLRNPLFRNDAELEAACLNALQSTGFVPNLRATGSFGRDRWVFYDHAPGKPWQRGVEPVAHLLRELHDQPVTLTLPEGCNGSDDLARHGAQILAGCRSEQRSALANLQPQHAVSPLPRRYLVHGDPVPGNILVSDTGLTLIDWQCPVFGDPCEDLAMFLSPAMQQLYRAAPLSSDEEAKFLSAYGNPTITARYRALRPWYAWRMAAYCLWRAENGATDYQTGFELEIKAL